MQVRIVQWAKKKQKKAFCFYQRSFFGFAKTWLKKLRNFAIILVFQIFTAILFVTCWNSLSFPTQRQYKSSPLTAGFEPASPRMQCVGSTNWAKWAYIKGCMCVCVSVCQCTFCTHSFFFFISLKLFYFFFSFFFTFFFLKYLWCLETHTLIFFFL